MNKVIIYTTPTCAFCRLAKEFFKENNVLYEEVDVAADHSAAQHMIKKSGQLGTPVIVVTKDGQENVVIGFDKPKLSQLLGIN